LTVKRVERLLSKGSPGKHTDAGGVKGLMLCIEGKASAHWILRYQRNKVTRHMGLGGVHMGQDGVEGVTLAAARAKARRERDKLDDGVDPLAVKHAERVTAAAAAAKRLTFKEAAERFHEAHEAGWSNARHRDEFLSSLRRWVYPHIGDLDVAAIGKDDVLRVLEQKLKKEPGTFWTKRTITADRTRNRVERVLDWAEARGFRAAGTPNPARWKGFLEALLPPPRKVAPVQNLRAIRYQEVPNLMAILAADETVAALALRFLILTAGRIGEVVGATWDEFDLDAAEWTIPKERMKGRRVHTVPLSPQVLALLEQLPREDGNPHLFISPTKPGAAIAHSSVEDARERAGCEATQHGFRSCFKTWSDERTNFPSIVAELCLAHRVGNAVEEAYRRTDLVLKRRKLLEAWGTFCMSLWRR
jgi:integrase